MLILIAVIVIGGGGTWGYFYWTNILPTSQIKITVNKLGVSPDGKPACTDPTYPLYILLFNDSRKTLNYISYRLIAKRPDRSTNLVSEYERTSDYITEPGIGAGGCQAVPPLSFSTINWRDLDWSAEINYTQFE